MQYNVKLLVWACVVSLALGACDRSIEASNGLVVEKGTGKPVSDAIVAIRWSEMRSTWGGRYKNCVRAETVHTNDKGEFRVPSFLRKMTLNDWMEASPPTVDAAAFRQGYESDGHWSDPGKLTLSLFDGTPQQYAAYLESMKWVDCSSTGGKIFFPLNDAVESAALDYPAYKPPQSICIACSTPVQLPPDPKPTLPRDRSKGTAMEVSGMNANKPKP